MRPGREHRLGCLLLWLIFSLHFPSSTLSQPAKEPDQDKPCSTSGLPNGLQKKLSTEFGSWKIQELADLAASAKARWYAAEYNGCAGIADGEFREKNRTSYAVLLVPKDKPNTAYRLLIYSPSQGTAAEESAVIEKNDSQTASNFFLHAEKTDKLFDEESRLKRHITTTDAVLLFDAGENEYEVDAYYWSAGVYRSSTVDM